VRSFLRSLVGPADIFVYDGATPPRHYARSLHDALPISVQVVAHQAGQRQMQHDERDGERKQNPQGKSAAFHLGAVQTWRIGWTQDRKSTRLNSSHVKISYAVFCLKKKNAYGRTRSINNI